MWCRKARVQTISAMLQVAYQFSSTNDSHHHHLSLILSLDLRRLITSDKACTVAISGYEVYLVGLEINSGRFEGGGTRLEPRTGVCRRDNGQVGTYSCGIRSVGKRANSIEFDLDRPPSRLDLLSRAAIQSIKLIIIAVGTRNAAGCATFPGNRVSLVDLVWISTLGWLKRC